MRILRFAFSLITLICMSEVAFAQLTDSLVRYYKLDDVSNSSSARDEVELDGVGVNDLTVSSNSRKSLPTAGVTGQVGTAWDFEKNPTVAVGDYDNSGGPLNGLDFLVWQQNAGTSNVLPGDPTPGTVDSSDLLNWENRYGLDPNTAPLLDDQGFPLGQFLDEGNSVWDGTNAINGAFFSIWVRPESLNAGVGEESRNVIISEDSAGQDFYVRSTEGGKVEMAFEGIGEVVTDNVELSVGQWSHISGGLIVDDGFEFTNTLILYVDGVQAGFNDFASVNTPDSFNDLTLGIQDDRADDIDEVADPNNPLLGYFARTSWDGLMDEAAFWRRALSSAEVVDIYDRGVLGQGLLDPPPVLALAAVPEPTTVTLLATGLLGLVTIHSRKKSRTGKAFS